MLEADEDAQKENGSPVTNVDIRAFIEALESRFSDYQGKRDEDELFGIAWSTDASDK